MSKGNEIFPVRLTPEAKKALQKDAIARGLSMSSVVKERLAIGTSFPPHISEMLDNYSKFLGAGHEEVVKRIVIWHFAVIEAGIKETRKAPSLYTQAPFVKFKGETSDEYLFDFMEKVARMNIEFNMAAKLSTPAPKGKMIAFPVSA